MIGCKGLPGFYIRWKEGGREQDSRETERECVWEAEYCSKRKIASAIKQTVREKTCDANVWLIIANYRWSRMWLMMLLPSFASAHLFVSKWHLDPTTSRKFPTISSRGICSKEIDRHFLKKVLKKFALMTTYFRQLYECLLYNICSTAIYFIVICS